MNKNFDECFEKLLGYEGGYSNNENDAGGETYKGISRVYYPYLELWDIIDRYKGLPRKEFEKKLSKDKELNKLVKVFYKNEYWNAMNLNSFNEFPKIQYELFDTAINMGKKNAVKILQRAINLLNRNEKICMDLKVDGILGRITLKSFYKIVEYDKSDKYIYFYLNLLQGERYVKSMEKRKQNENFARGWTRRLQFC